MTDPIRIGRPMISPLERNDERLEIGLEHDGPSFGDVFTRVLNGTSEMQQNAQDTIASFLRGDPVELHQVMAASEEASISLELLVEIRNKLTDAYRTVMNLT